MKFCLARRLAEGAVCVLALMTVAAAADPPANGTSAQARALFQQGKYAEADEAFRALPAGNEAANALGIARCQEATGEREKSVETLKQAAEKSPQDAALPAELARLALERGDYVSAQAAIEAALKLDADQVLAHWVRAELLCAMGKLDEANAEYRWLVGYRNEHDVHDVESLYRIGLAAGQFARWNRLSDQFGLLVNEFYPDLLTRDATFWQAHYEAGRLFAEKYNQADAAKELKAALVLNPNAAEIHAALGQLSLEEFELSAAQSACQRALEINPQSLDALLLKADIHLANFEARQAVAVLGDALKLHPTSEATLGRMAEAYAAVDGLSRQAAQSRFDKLVAEVTTRNPHAGMFFEAMADALDRLRRWPAAAQYYQQAVERMPQLARARGQWGMMLMRLGDEPRAKQVLHEAFDADPFNVRVNNSLKVLEVLDGYETLETEHFLIRFDPQHDKILARYLGQWLEEVYPQLVERMGAAPQGKSLFEVFSHAKNTDGHGWFSARMVGLPHIHPIGACAGKIVALQSPSEGRQRFNWARVVKHEFVHVINLQQTEFNIPHWFTEALAVLSEGYPRPQSWDELLAARGRQNKLFDLDSINLGFIRPHSSDDWTLAYCQASLYAQYMLDQYGHDAVAKMLSAYADNLTTAEALQRALGVNQTDFERGYRAFVDQIVAQVPASRSGDELSPGALERALAKNPRDANLLAKMAQAHLARRDYPQARRSADAALAIDPRNALASYVRARLHLLVGENAEALKRLEGALDRQNPQENLLALLAGLKLKAEDYKSAAELYELGAQHEPNSLRWQKSLAAVYLKSGEDNKLAAVLARLADADADDLPVRKKLAELMLDKDPPSAARWALDGLHIDVMDVELHKWRAKALSAQGAHAPAADEYAVAVELAPDELPLRMALAETCVKSGQPKRAKEVLEELLKLDADYPEAGKLLESLR